MPRRYSMAGASQVAQVATREITAWLTHLPQTLTVQNVEADAAFQQIDVDLIWTTRTRAYQIEIKGDRWDRTGNFFFETISNREKATPGCFLYTRADLVFYYFVAARTLYILPMPETRAWFLENQTRYPERATTTPVGNTFYTTVGRLVPIREVVRNVAGVKQQRLAQEPADDQRPQ